MVTLVMMIEMIVKSFDGGTMVMLVIMMMMMMKMMILIEEMKGIRFWTDVLRDHR